VRFGDGQKAGAILNVVALICGLLSKNVKLGFQIHLKIMLILNVEVQIYDQLKIGAPLGCIAIAMATYSAKVVCISYEA
jgi:hypothetical protein